MSAAGRGESGNVVSKFYHQVIEDVINSVRDSFTEEGIDEQVLLDLRAVWERKLDETKSVDHSTTRDTDDSAQPTTTITPSTPAKRETAAQRKAREKQQNQQSGRANNALASQPHQGNEQPMSVQSTLRQNLITNQQQPPAQQALPAAQQQLSLGQVVIDSNGRMLGLTAAHGQKILLAPASQPQGMLMSTAAATASIALPPQMPFINSATLQANSSGAGIPGVQFGASSAAAQNSSQASRPNQQNSRIVQLDGPNDDSSDDDDDVSSGGDNDDDRDDNDDDENDNDNDEANEEEEEPLNSEDDVSDEDPHELFDVENVVVCQYDKITRSRNKWKFHFKDGIMNLKGKDYVFQRAVGDAEW